MEIAMSRLPAVRPLCALSFPPSFPSASSRSLRMSGRPSFFPPSLFLISRRCRYACLPTCICSPSTPIFHILTGLPGSPSPADNKIRPATTPPFSLVFCHPRERAGGQSGEGKDNPSTLAAFPMGWVASPVPKGHDGRDGTRDAGSSQPPAVRLTDFQRKEPPGGRADGDAFQPFLLSYTLPHVLPGPQFPSPLVPRLRKFRLTTLVMGRAIAIDTKPPTVSAT
ncbi:hypothetical protein CGRA01v4_05120 [Colletotrichum graminicola]|nr:hypothetical protein CGRA01v4_05120 [Colletotrichum graminicola]